MGDEASNELDFTNAPSNLAETTIFQPGELSSLRDEVAKIAATGAFPRSGPVDLPKPAGPDAANVVALIKWPSGATTEFSTQLNIGRDGRFCRFATELISELQVSRRHAVLEVCAEGIWVRDLDSRNGTFVDYEKVPSGQAVLVDRDALIRFGPHCVVQLTLKR